MIPTVRKLSKSVRILICASKQINSFSKAVQELVFNALDADATSIAVRIHIDDGSIQVVDNGYGISEADFKYIGQNYMTSKLVDISILKSAPNKYGFQGQSLANLARITESMRVISRSYECETTCVKTFEKGKEKLITKCSQRPSKGTTVEIKGFLFNLNIQKKSVDTMNELQNIKTFLEHISLVHSSISLSLRDDSKNEIVYKIHKNRDMYQTLYSLYEIDKSNVQELQVEKNQYKVKAYVGKRDIEISKQLIFLNGKCINDASLLHTKVNDSFKKHSKSIKMKIQKNINDDEETHIFGNNNPFYFIFIKCPYMDYELTNTVLEFKDWGQVNTILDKLVKFYMGDTQLQAIPKNQIKNINNKKNNESTRNHIEKIMHKILGSRNKKPAISQMQNGIKGKLIKRKPKNKKGVSKISIKVKDRQDISKHGLGPKVLIEEQNPKNDSILRIQPQQSASNRNKHSSSHLSNILIENTKNVSVTKTKNIKCKNKLPKRLNKNNHERLMAKIKDKTNLKKIYLNDKFALETESVKQRCKLLAEETEKLMKHNKINHPDVFINENVQYTSSNFVNGNKNIDIRTKVNEIVIHEYIPLPPKTNFGKQIVNDSQFKSNYDLLKTIINTQQENLQESGRKKAQDYLVSSTTKPDFYNEMKTTKSNNAQYGDEKSSKKNCVSRVLNHQSLNELTTPKRNTSHTFRESKDVYLWKDLKPYNNRTQELDAHDNDRLIPVDAECNLSLMRELSGISPLQTDIPSSSIKPYFSETSGDASSFQAVTFQSHNYERKYQTSPDVELNNLYKKPKKFITTRSIENFLNFPKDNKFKTSYVDLLSTLVVQSNNQKRKWNKPNKLMDIKKNIVKGIRESYTIEFTGSNEFEYPSINSLGNRQDTVYIPSRINADILEEAAPTSVLLNKSFDQCMTPMNPRAWLVPTKNADKHSNLQHKTLNQNTYIISDSHQDNDNNIEITLNSEIGQKNETYSIENGEETCYNRSEAIENLNNNNENTSFLFVSKSQEDDNNKQIMDPIDVCKTILIDQEFSTDRENELNISFNSKQDVCNNLNEIDYDNIGVHLTNKSSLGKNILSKTPNQKEITETSHHFTIPNTNISKRLSPMLLQNQSPIPEAQLEAKMPLDKLDALKQNKDGTVLNEQHDMEAYSIRNRMCFVPKGMSPIFKKCQTKSIYDFNPNEEYYTDKIYDEFLKKVQNYTEIFKPHIRDTNELTSKDISKINRKENCDASLKFDGQCIKNAKVLGQVDYKFIAAIMKSKSLRSEDFKEFLVLFDQHAVHERIRLENNLADYLMGSQWKSVTIDEVSLKITRDDILYLHNYRDKFTQFGLQWNIINPNELSISAIPEGILGKNPRQVEKIIKAVKNLITEEIRIIQMQRGCVSIYPKSIMELVFSEACRYAIKFGDYLSKSRCMELLNELSACKTPFQCAHGRPSMAVIMDIEGNQADYKINFKKIQQFKMFNR